ncbi:MAG: putative membrane protein YdbT with pleckstrin-like domain [Oceanicoccus sp.]|jgi:uncharacterized membrane protein YdbT with pleckstrin-like domain
MRRKSNINFRKNYKIRETVWKLFGKIILWQLIMVFVSYMVIVGLSESFIFVSAAFNLLGVSYIVLAWLNRFYIVSEEAISKTTGVFFSQTRTFDIGSIVSVKLKQNIISRIFGYGSVVLENALTEEDITMEDVNAPYKQASLIEKQRLKEISGSPRRKIVPR